MMSSRTAMGFDALFEIGDRNIFLNKAQEKCRHMGGKTFAGMEKEEVAQEILNKLKSSLDKHDSDKSNMSTFVDQLWKEIRSKYETL